MSKENDPVITIVSVTTREKRRDKSRKGGVGSLERKTKMYFSPEGETVLDQFLVGRRTRPNTLLRKLIPEALKRANVANLSEYTKSSWSRKAGCTCGCSPGFVLSEWASVNIFVTYKIEERACVI
jgi:hypothetical protein